MLHKFLILGAALILAANLLMQMHMRNHGGYWANYFNPRYIYDHRSELVLPIILMVIGFAIMGGVFIADYLGFGARIPLRE